MANSTAPKLAIGESAPRLPLPPPLLQMAIQRAEATLAKTRSSAYRCSQTLLLTAEHQLASVGSVPVPAVLRSSIQLKHRLYLSNRCVAPTLTTSLRNLLSRVDEARPTENSWLAASVEQSLEGKQ